MLLRGQTSLWMPSRGGHTFLWSRIAHLSVKCVTLEFWVCVFYYCRTYYKAVRVGGEESGGHVL
jgi:hypothetical protein